MTFSTLTYHDSLQNYDSQVSVANLADLPSDSDLASLGPEIAAIEGEIDEDSNPIIRDMKTQCSRDQLDYCVGESWKSKDHTMCKFCVSRMTTILNPTAVSQIFTSKNICVPVQIQLIYPKLYVTRWH